MKRTFLFTIFFILMVGAATLGRASIMTCYGPEEAEADAALRYQAELRITGLTCQDPRTFGKMFPTYQGVINNNSSVFLGYQKTLLSYYRRNLKGDPAKYLRGRETEVENELALDAAHQGAVPYCKAKAPILLQAALESSQQIKQDIVTYQYAHRPLPLCARGIGQNH